jgi:hypothetical protein
MDVLAGYQPGGRASLDLVAQLLGFPGKLGMSGSRVWESYQRGELADIRWIASGTPRSSPGSRRSSSNRARPISKPFSRHGAR